MYRNSQSKEFSQCASPPLKKNINFNYHSTIQMEIDSPITGVPCTLPLILWPGLGDLDSLRLAVFSGRSVSSLRLDLSLTPESHVSYSPSLESHASPGSSMARLKVSTSMDGLDSGAAGCFSSSCSWSMKLRRNSWVSCWW